MRASLVFLFRSRHIYASSWRLWELWDAVAPSGPEDLWSRVQTTMVTLAPDKYAL